jgi:hypothetical protein
MLCLASTVARADLVTVRSAAGPITVASDVAHKFVSLIDDLVAHGFRGHVHCFSATGHIRHSLHHTGRACDFSQRGWNKTVHPMYSSTALIVAHGLRDGCTFHRRKDCGHVDAGLTRSPVARLLAYGRHHKVFAEITHHGRSVEVRHHRHRYASRHHHHRRYG